MFAKEGVKAAGWGFRFGHRGMMAGWVWVAKFSAWVGWRRAGVVAQGELSVEVFADEVEFYVEEVAGVFGV